jgi:starch phosphorylase
VFDVQVYYLDELDSQAVRVELYANGVTGTAAERVAMQCLRQLGGASNGYADRPGCPRAARAEGLRTQRKRRQARPGRG